MIGFLTTACLVTACGAVTSSGSNDRDELRRLVERDDDVERLWDGIGLSAPVDVSFAADTRPTAVVVWIEDYDQNLTLDHVSAAHACDDECVRLITEWAKTQQASTPLPAVAENTPCGNCFETSRLSLITIDEHGDPKAVDRAERTAVLGDIDTPYEVMLEVGQPAKVRPEGDGWRVVLHRVVSDCDPFIDEYTMWSLDSHGERAELAQFETSDNSCA